MASSSGPGVTERITSRPAVRTVAAVVGATFLLIGILGFIPGVTTNYDDLKFAGHESGAGLFGVFQVSVLHNIVHVLFGVAGLALTRRTDWARLYLVGGGALYLLLWLYGLVIDHRSSANVIPVNVADNYLHLLLGLGMLILGFILSPRQTGATADARR